MTPRDRVGATALAGTITLAMATATFMQYALGALGPFIREDLELSHGALGSLTTSLFVSSALLSPVIGSLVDRYGGRRSLVALFAAGGVGAVGAAAAPVFAVLLLAIAVAGVSNALGNPSTNKLLALHVPARQQGVVTGIKQSGVQFGAFVAGAALPPVAENVGWRVAMALSAIGAVIGLAVTSFAVPASGPILSRAGRPRGADARLGSAIVSLSWYAGLMGAGVGAVSAFLPTYAVEELGLSRTTAGLVASVTGAVGVLARLLLGARSDRSVRPASVALGWLAVGGVVATAVLATASVDTLWLLWLGAVGFGATAIAWNAVGMLSILRGVKTSASGRASGRVLFGFFSGLLVGPALYGLSIDLTDGYTAGWIGVGVAFVLASLVAARWHAQESRERRPAGV